MTARWSSWKGNGVPDDDSVVADQDLLDQQSDHALTLDYAGRKKLGRQVIQRLPSAERPPPATTQCRWG
jgi:hypothetical protein